MIDSIGDIYPADICVLRYALERNADAKPDRIFAAFDGGERWSFAQTLQQVRITAANLHALGVRQGDHVVLMLPNSALALRVMFAINYLGAVFVPVNPALKGSALQHILTDSGASVAILHETVLDTVMATDPSALTTVICAATSRATRRSGSPFTISQYSIVPTRRPRRSRGRSGRSIRSRSSTRPAPPAVPRACCRPICTAIRR